jgi:hypothetical protein
VIIWCVNKIKKPVYATQKQKQAPFA